MPASNPTTSIVQHFLARCDYAIHLTQLGSWFSDLAIKPINRSLKASEEILGNKDAWGAGSCGTIVNLFHHTNSYLLAPYGSKWTAGDLIHPIRQELELRHYCLCLSLVYEEWEKFIKAFAPHVLHHRRQEYQLKQTEVERLLRGNPNLHGLEETLEFYTQFVAFKTRSSASDIYADLRKSLRFSELVMVTTCPKYRLPWFESIRFISFCRNHFVHADGRVTEERLSSLGPQLTRLVKKRMAKSKITGDERLFIDKKDFDALVVCMASLANALYVLGHHVCDWELDYDSFSHMNFPPF